MKQEFSLLCTQVECAIGYAQPRGWVSVLYVFGKRRAVKFTRFKSPFYGDEKKLTGSKQGKGESEHELMIAVVGLRIKLHPSSTVLVKCPRCIADALTVLRFAHGFLLGFLSTNFKTILRRHVREISRNSAQSSLPKARDASALESINFCTYHDAKKINYAVVNPTGHHLRSVQTKRLFPSLAPNGSGRQCLNIPARTRSIKTSSREDGSPDVHVSKLVGILRNR
jgi:hypothetical protein